MRKASATAITDNLFITSSDRHVVINNHTMNGFWWCLGRGGNLIVASSPDEENLPIASYNRQELNDLR